MASHTQLHMLESEDGRGSDHGIIRKTAIDGGVPQCLRADVRRARAHVVRAEDGTQAWKSSMPLMAPSSKEQLPLKVPCNRTKQSRGDGSDDRSDARLRRL